MSRCLLTVCLALALVAPLRADDAFEPWVYMERDVFPSLLISTATIDWNEDADEEEADEEETPCLGDRNGYFGVCLTDIEEGAEIRVEVSGQGFLKKSVFTTTAEEDYEEVIVIPKGVYDFDALHKCRQQRPVNLVMKVTVDGELLGEQTKSLTLRSVNDCPWAVVQGEDEPPYDCSWMFAAYVNENHPLIDEILKEALQSEMIDSFTGYQSGKEEVVHQQVFAIWHVLQRRGIKYSDISTSPRARQVYSQHVRFLDDSIKATQANCVDGSVLMASILTKIGLNAHLVMVPGHCYLAYDASAEPAEDQVPVGLETTMLGNSKLRPLATFLTQAAELEAARQKGELNESMQKLQAALKEELESSQAVFLEAIKTGTGNLKENQEKFEAADSIEYQLISIPESREFGITPLSPERLKD